jgi:ribonuclease T2
MRCEEIPCAREQGIFAGRTGNFFAITGKNREFAWAEPRPDIAERKFRRSDHPDGWAVIMFRFVLRMVLGVCLLATWASPDVAQGGGLPGHFDFFVLALSWSPSFCAAAAERGSNRVPSMQCGPRPYSFVVHGLWPQYERGFPQNCQTPAPRLDHATMSSMLDLMPAPGLIFHEWDSHGTCSGLSPRAYFATVRKARVAVTIPPEFAALQKPLSVSPAAVEDAFVKANPGLAPSDMAVGCDSRRLTEVRLCLAKDLKFRGCPEIVRRSCRRDRILMPPVRGAAN